MDWEVVIAAPLVGAWKGDSGIRRTGRKNTLEDPDIYKVSAKLEIEGKLCYIQVKRRGMKVAFFF